MQFLKQLFWLSNRYEYAKKKEDETNDWYKAENLSLKIEGWDWLKDINQKNKTFLG